MLKGFEDKTATAVCTVAYVDEWGQVNMFIGEASGTIVEPPADDNFGWGWDTCFKPDGYDMTYAQMSKEEKNLTSYRMKAMFKLKEFLDKNCIN